MSTETTKPATVNLPSITRNGVSFTLSEQVFGKKAPNKGKTFFAPEATPANWDSFVVWAGLDNIINPINRVLRRTFADIFLDEANWDDMQVVKDGENKGEIVGGTINMERYLADCADFTAGVAKLSDLQDQIDELQDQLSALAMDPGYILDDNDQPTETYVKISEQMRDITKKIRPIKQQKAAIELKYAERAAKRKAKEENSPTKS
jgi:Xaa-Pro aminopeptidase